MQETGNFKEKLLNGKTLVGGWVSLNSAASAEVMAYAGFDWVAIDVEHSSSSASDVENIVKSIKLHNRKPLARIFDNSTVSIRRVMDAGAEGIIVPMVRNVQDVKLAIEALKYPPVGKRGAGAAAANIYGTNLGEHVAKANAETLLIVMVETKEAVENIDDILSIPEVDGVFMGPFDLSASYGIIGQTGNQMIIDAMDIVSASCKKHGKAAGMHMLSSDVSVINRAINKGFTFLALSFDANFIFEGSKKIIESAHQAISMYEGNVTEKN